MSEETHATAIKAALTATGANPYDYDEVPGTGSNPGTSPARYTQVAVARRFGGNPRSTAESGVEGYRVTTRAVGDNVTNARTIRARGHAALEDKRLVVDGVETGPIKFEAAEQIAEDDEGFHSGLTSWTYTY